MPGNNFISTDPCIDWISPFSANTLYRMAYQEYVAEQTSDLIEYMRMTAPQDKEAADDAFHAFILRFRDFLQKSCRSVAAAYGYLDAEGDEIATETFLRFRSATNFAVHKCKSTDIEKCVKLYLSKIANTVLVDRHRKVARQRPFTGDEQVIYDLPEQEDLSGDIERSAVLKKKREVLRDILYNRLSYKQRVVYLTHMQVEHQRNGYDQDGKLKRYNMPSELLDKLEQELDITRSTIRKYHNEAKNIVEPLLSIYGNH